MNGIKKLLVKCFDSNDNGKLEFSEIFYPLVLFLLIELVVGVLSNFVYDILRGAIKLW